LGYRPQRKAKQGGGSLHLESTKAIYLGTRGTHKQQGKAHPYGRMHRLEMFKLLFEGFVTGEWRVQSEAKRKYYHDCREELRGRMAREYPGREIEKRLAAIE
jgi:hypothetical protein